MATWVYPFLAFAKAFGLAICLVLLRGLLWLVNLLVFAPPFDPLGKIPGPAGSFFESHFEGAGNPQESPKAYAAWRKAHGNTFRFQGFGKHDYRLMTFDFRAIAHIFTSTTYEKPWQTRSYLSRMIGNGIFSMEGHEHKVQRKVISPAFSAQAVKGVSPIFAQKADQLCDIWDSQVDAASQSQNIVVNVAHWFSRTTFDIIGLSGFNYNFDSLADESEPIHLAFRRMFRTLDKGIGPRDIVELYFPILRTIWPSEDGKIIKQSLKEIEDVGQTFISEKKANVQVQQGSHQKDILSLLIKSNLSLDSSARLSDKDLLDQCTTFLLAGSDSSSVAMSWALHLLATHPDIQRRLYAEIQVSIKASKNSEDYDSDASDDSGFAEDPKFKHEASIHSGRASFIEAIQSMPYLDGVVREALRLYPPVHSTIRVATQDDEIPLSEPISVSGEFTTSVKIRKGSFIHIPIEGINGCEALWGADAQEFNPLRWSKLPKAVTNGFPGLGSLMSFGYGPHACLGFQFTASEIKTVLATVVSRFEFSPADDVKINKYNCIITRPFVEGCWKDGAQLPLKIRRRN
ncbi:cytochrome P450 [Coprinopsis marcescibilis]|uniref:Cytochrome P450 n=1 Tax=Coprinopsis marcescibilis TaxID=230819 RepID=A0A5C3LFL1_COPMA|nr:cytochrome P450 [Coprinopsis marcescibilis]